MLRTIKVETIHFVEQVDTPLAVHIADEAIRVCFYIKPGVYVHETIKMTHLWS